MITVNDKLNQIDEEWSTGRAIMPSGSFRVNDRMLADYVPKLVRCLRVFKSVSPKEYNQVAEILGADAHVEPYDIGAEMWKKFDGNGRERNRP